MPFADHNTPPPRRPVCDGHAATVRIREIERARGDGARPVPIVALSASCSEEEIRRCTASGMDAHIAKPLRLDSLAIFSRLLGGAGGSSAEQQHHLSAAAGSANRRSSNGGSVDVGGRGGAAPAPAR